jgi:hypothetical protein
LDSPAHIRHRPSIKRTSSKLKQPNHPTALNPTNTHITHQALNLMGAVLTCLGLSSSAIKKSRDKKKASQTGATTNESAPQPLPPQAASSQAGAESQSVKDAQQALQDEHLATVSPLLPSSGEQEQEHSRTETEAAGITEVQKEVATAAPLPTA